MEVSAKKLNIDPYEVAKINTKRFFEDIEKLHIEKPEHITPATEYIKEMEEYVERIVDNGYAYETSKGIYFDTSKLSTYGELSKIDLEKQLAGARIEIDEEKRNPLDFVLWIKAPESHIMKWNSKWGMCYPGWHIECSAMAYKHLGEKIDIHTGGVDHINIHHENEIAQSRGAFGVNPANYWMHNEFLLIDSGKMSKSLNNNYTIKDLEERGYEPLSYRYLTYTTVYKNKLNFTWEALDSAQKSLLNLRRLYNEHLNSKSEDNSKKDKIDKYTEEFNDSLFDDLNFPNAMSIVWKIAKQKEKDIEYANLLKKFDLVLSLDIDKKENESAEDKNNLNIDNFSENIKEILLKRETARKNKDYKLSDILRDELLELGYKVIDKKDSQEIEKI